MRVNPRSNQPEAQEIPKNKAPESRHITKIRKKLESIMAEEKTHFNPQELAQKMRDVKKLIRRHHQDQLIPVLDNKVFSKASQASSKYVRQLFAQLQSEARSLSGRISHHPKG